MKKIITFIFLVSITVSNAQQEISYSNFIYNQGEFNPGYVLGDPDLVQIGAIHRIQWQGVIGAPDFTSVFSSIPIGENFETKINLNRASNGPSFNDYNAGVNLAYYFNLSEKFKLSAGINFGFKYSLFDLGALGAKSTSNSSGEKFNDIKGNVGAGLFLYSDYFYMGLSIPKLFNQSKARTSFDDILPPTANGLSTSYLTAGFIIKAGENVKIKPSLLYGRTSLDIREDLFAIFDKATVFASLNVMFYDRVEIGTMYKHTDSFTGLLSYNTYKNFKLGYAYDYGFGDIGTISSGSHEFILIYTFDTLRSNKKYSSPRFF